VGALERVRARVLGAIAELEQDEDVERVLVEVARLHGLSVRRLSGGQDSDRDRTRRRQDADRKRLERGQKQDRTALEAGQEASVRERGVGGLSLSDLTLSLSEADPRSNVNGSTAEARGRAMVEEPSEVRGVISLIAELPQEARDGARMLGLSAEAVEGEWRAFRAHHHNKATPGTPKGFAALFVDRWCPDAKRFAARRPAGAPPQGTPTPGVSAAEARRRDQERRGREARAVGAPPEAVALAAALAMPASATRIRSAAEQRDELERLDAAGGEK
jgi:hypothetical protein